jgi:hypothetical protein
MDINEIEARGLYSPPNGNHPQVLPDRWREDFHDAPVRTDLPYLTDEELNYIGWKGPIKMPEGTSLFTHSYQWNKETREYDAVELSDFEKIQNIDYQNFWDALLYTNAYSTIKKVSSQSLEANVLATEFIALISDAKVGKANTPKIQQALTAIFSTFTFTAEEIEEIREVFMNNGMFILYTLD